MVLWEITLGAAYVLGIKRTYRLGLRIQRKLITANHPNIRQFLQRRTRNVFDVVLKVQQKLAARNPGKFILQSFKRIKSNASICSPPPSHASTTTKMIKQPQNAPEHNSQKVFPAKNTDKESSRHLFTAVRNLQPKSFPTIAMMMRPTSMAGHNIQHRQFNSSAEFFTVKRSLRSGFGDVIRNDVRQWLLHQ